MDTLENHPQVLEKCGPCRDRTYDQLIKSRHTATNASCSTCEDNSSRWRLETTPFRGVLHAAFARILAPYSTADRSHLESAP